jgi:hypothetical protein
MNSLPYALRKIAGVYGPDKRWVPHPEWVVPGSFQVKKPSSNFPYSYLRHFMSEKYFKLLKEHKPELLAQVVKGLILNQMPLETYPEFRKRIKAHPYYGKRKLFNNRAPTSVPTRQRKTEEEISYKTRILWSDIYGSFDSIKQEDVRDVIDYLTEYRKSLW